MTFLKVIQPSAAPPPFIVTAADVTFGPGFYNEEHHEGQAYRWMGLSGELQFAAHPEPRYLELWVFSEFHNLSQRLMVRAGTQSDDCVLTQGWSPLSLAVPGGADRLSLTLNRLFPAEYYPTDPRTLGVRVRDVRLHADRERHAAIAAQYRNLVLNTQEIIEGKTDLRSTPPSLGIDLHGVCNVKPPCVYCEWDYSKALEGPNVDVPFTVETLREWGPFFDQSASLVNCSIGEPFMMKNFDDLLDAFGNAGKALEMTTNGQILTDRNIQKLLGRPIDLYISLDAATPLTYSRLRNNTFEKILANLRRLVAAKGERTGLPRVHLVFMPMKCNVHELDAFVRLCADLPADRMVLRPLNYSDSIALDWERAGYRFTYKDELLPFETLVRVSGRAARLARDLGVDLADQMDFGGSMRELFEDEFAKGEQIDTGPMITLSSEIPPGEGLTAAQPAGSAPPPPAEAMAPVQTFSAEGAPLPSLGAEQRPACLEPWKSLYILRRGVLPCCYGGSPIAEMKDYRQAWNSPLMQAIRTELLQGRFHDYCLRSPACPIVRKSEEAATLPFKQRLLMRARHVWWRFNRDTRGLPSRYIYFPIRWFAIRARRAATDPQYWVLHTKRAWRKLTGQ
ncbi:MAG TPA: radical SAM/SPASM domain-containing protein [Vicinamibacterales bacterium]|nr:radical SAM/SPASM domain-containing protein [Vicinamibacterales bacterium]